MNSQSQADTLAYYRLRKDFVLQRVEINIAALIEERDAVNNLLHESNTERLNLKDERDQLLEEKEAWKRDANLLITYARHDERGCEKGFLPHLPCACGLDAIGNNHFALVEKYKE